MKSFLIFGGLFIIIFICIIPLSRKIQEYNIQKNGKLVNVTLIYIPNYFGSKISFIKFIYAGKLFEKIKDHSMGKGHKVGEEIKMKHMEGSDIFLFEKERIEEEFIALGILALFGIKFIVMGIRRK